MIESFLTCSTILTGIIAGIHTIWARTLGSVVPTSTSKYWDPWLGLRLEIELESEQLLEGQILP